MVTSGREWVLFSVCFIAIHEIHLRASQLEQLYLNSPNAYHALSPCFLFYNFIRIHKTYRITPAMAAGITDRLWSVEDIVRLVDEAEIAAIRGKRRAMLSERPHSN